MKTLKLGSKILRVEDSSPKDRKTIDQMVSLGWGFISKKDWKETREVKKEKSKIKKVKKVK
jgi:hypothetical protein